MKNKTNKFNYSLSKTKGWLDTFENGGALNNIGAPKYKSMQEAESDPNLNKSTYSGTPYNTNRDNSEVFQEGKNKGKITGKGALEESISPLDFIGLGEVKGLLNFGKKILPNAKKTIVKNIIKPKLTKTEELINKVKNSPDKNSIIHNPEPIKTPNKWLNPDNEVVSKNGFIDTKGFMQKYPKGKLTQEEIEAYKNSQQYKDWTKQHLEQKSKYGESWTLPNFMEEELNKAIETGKRNRINETLYGGSNWSKSHYAIAAMAGTAYPGLAGIYGLAFSPPAIKNKVLNKAGITNPTDGGLSDRDTTINLDGSMDFAKVNEFKNGQIILGGEFIEDSNNSVRKAKDWLSAKDTYSDKKYNSKDIESFYGVENGKFKVGKANEFDSNTEIVPRRFGAKSISKAILNGKEMRILDNEGKLIYQNTPNTGKFILYSPSTKKSEFNYINKGQSGVDKVNKFLKENKDAEYIHLDNGRYEYYGINKDGLTKNDFERYYQQDLERKGKPGYNLIIKKNGGWLDKLN